MEGAKGANGPQGSGFYEDFSVKETHIPVPVEINEVVTIDEQDPAFLGYTRLENRRMCTGEPDAPLPSFLETFGKTAGATAAEVSRTVKRTARLAMSVTEDVVAACEEKAGYPGITRAAYDIGTYGGRLLVLAGAHYCGFTAAQPMPADPTEAVEADDAANMVPPA